MHFYPFFFHSKGSADEGVDDPSAGAAVSDHEDGEIDERLEKMTHPMVTLTQIDPKDIPEVSNKFLMRGTQKRKDNAHSDEDEGSGGGTTKGTEKDRRTDRDGGRRRDAKDAGVRNK